jgi:ABC-type sulfate transport system permease subunit
MNYNLQVITDEVKVHNLESTVQSKLFNITLPINSVFGVEVGTTITADDGWYLMPEALSAGTPDIRFGVSGVINPTTSTYSYIIDITLCSHKANTSPII